MVTRREIHACNGTHERGAGIPEFAQVTLTHEVLYRGVRYPEGTPGVVVHTHDDDAFEVEVEHPAFAVITLKKKQITVSQVP